MKLTKFGLAAVFATTVALSSATAGVTDKDILNDQATPGDIVSYGMGPRAQRFSPLKQLNKKNIGRLVPAWAFSYGGEKQRGQEAQPLIYDGTIYVTASYSCVFAIDAALTAHAESYRSRFGVVPEFRAGLHGGPVVASQVGDSKQEIVYFGDTINTAARIQGECKRLGLRS